MPSSPGPGIEEAFAINSQLMNIYMDKILSFLMHMLSLLKSNGGFFYQVFH